MLYLIIGFSTTFNFVSITISIIIFFFNFYTISTVRFQLLVALHSLFKVGLDALLFQLMPYNKQKELLLHFQISILSNN